MSKIYPRLEVCRDFLKGVCKREDDACRYAHPTDHLEIVDNKVICCMDHIRDKCTRDAETCRYFHAPKHLSESLSLNQYSDDKRGRGRFQGRNQDYSSERGDNYGKDRSRKYDYNDSFRNRGGNGQNGFGKNSGDVDYRGKNLNGMNNNMSNQNLAMLTPALLPILSNLGAMMNGGNNGDGNLNSMVMETLMDYQKLLESTGNQFNNGNNNYGSQNQSYNNMDTFQNREDAEAEVCLHFRRNKCKYSEDECKYAHPPDRIKINSNNMVVVCKDFLREDCSRKYCMYFHPPDHLKKQLVEKFHSRKRKNPRDIDDRKFTSKRQR